MKLNFEDDTVFSMKISHSLLLTVDTTTKAKPMINYLDREAGENSFSTGQSRWLKHSFKVIQTIRPPQSGETARANIKCR